MEPNEEQAWIAEAQRGDAASFGRLVTLFQKKVYGFILGMVREGTVADDLTQATFVKSWKALPRYRGESAFQTWLFQIALNNVRSWGRWQKIRLFREKPLETQGTVGDEDSLSQIDRLADKRADADPSQPIESSDLKQLLGQAIQTLPPREKAVFMLRHYQDLPLKEIGVVMGIAEGSVKAHLSHALQKLRKTLPAEVRHGL